MIRFLEIRMVFTRTPVRVTFIVWLIAAMFCFGHGCSPDKESPLKEAGFVKHYTRKNIPLVLTIRGDRTEIDVSEFFTLTIRAITPSGFSAELPSPKDMNFGEFLISESSENRLAAGGDSTGVERRIVLEPQLSGKYTIAPFEVICRPTQQSADVKSPEVYRLRTEPLFFTVNSLSPGDPQRGTIRDISGPSTIRIPLWRRPLVWLVAIAFLGGMGFIFYRRHARKKEVALRVIPPHEKAREALRKLREENLIGKGLLEEFYVRLSGILRDYIGERFGLRAPERTTEEFLQDAATQDIFAPEVQRSLGQFLAHCDSVKFALYQPTETEMTDGFALTEDFVEKTIPREIEGGVLA